MGYTRKQREGQEVIKRMIMDGNRRGVCDTYGRTVKKDGRPVAKPRSLGPTARRYVWSKELRRLVQVK